MLTWKQKAQFERNGFLRIPAVFTHEQVKQLRDFSIRLFAADSPHEGDFNKKHTTFPGARFDICARYPESSWVLTHRPVVEIMRDLLGRDFVYLPETCIHDSGFGGWHKDTDAQQKEGRQFHWEPDFQMIQVAVYLQDNTPAYGGGIDVIPASHHRRGDTGKESKRGLRSWLHSKRWGAVPNKIYTVPHVIGDLVMFHFRLDHRATQPTVNPVPAEHRKLAFFFACSANNRHAGNYVDYISTRPDYAYMKAHRYPENVLREAAAREVTLL